MDICVRERRWNWLSLLVAPCAVLSVDFRHSQGILIIKFVIQSLGLMDTKVGVLMQVWINKQLFDKERIWLVDWSVVLRKGLFVQIECFLLQAGSWLIIEPTVVHVNVLREGPDANNEVIYWFVTFFLGKGFPIIHGKDKLR